LQCCISQCNTAIAPNATACFLVFKKVCRIFYSTNFKKKQLFS